MGIQTVRLYKNTVSSIPIGVFTDVSDQFDLGLGTIVNETLTETLTTTGLAPGTKYWFWIQSIDEAGNDSGILPLGSKHTKGLPSGTTFSASSTEKGAGPAAAFSGNVGTQFGGNPPNAWVAEAGLPQSISVDLGATRRVVSYKMWACPSLGYPDCASDWTLEGSLDGVNFTVLDTRVDSDPPYHNVSGPDIENIPHGTYTVATPGDYRYYSLVVTAAGGPNRQSRLSIPEMQLVFG